MNIDVVFHENECAFDADFGQVQTASDGGFERGYSAGYESGYVAGAATAEMDSARFATTMKFEDYSLFGGEVGEVTIYNQTSFASMFAVPKGVSNDTLRHLIVNSEVKPTSMNSMFRPASDSGVSLERLTLNFDTSNCTDFGNCFRGLRQLTVIDGTPLDFSAASTLDNYLFYVCTGLVEIRIKPQTIFKSIQLGTSHNLSDESIWSIIDGLADLTGGATQTITFSNTVKQRFGADKKDAISAKNWTLA